jgi:hypothetical protein
MEEIDIQAWLIDAAAPLTDAKPAAVKIKLAAAGDATTGGVGKFLQFLDANDNEVGSLDKLGRVFFPKLVTLTKKCITVTIDNGAVAITPGVKCNFKLPYNFTVSKVTAVAETVSGDGVGDITIDVWKSTFAAFPPTAGNSVTGATPIRITNSNKSQDASLVDWNKAWLVDEMLRFNVVSCVDIKRVELFIDGSEA